ncbi:hypothetical protein [Streptomyces sp. NPDC013740]|uniref:hypothetical protein n=1 Tax=Streptomyces sp. NPDC013740 TaxID=3364867 RepID=UPI0036FD02F0
MRPRVSPRLTALAISAVITLGAAGPALADESRPADTPAVASVPAPKVPADGVTDVLATVQKTVADLLASLSAGGATGVLSQVTSTLTSLVNLVTSTVLGSGLPLPELPAVPGLAKPDVSTDLPAGLPAGLPVDVPVKPPVDIGALPVQPPLSDD